METIMNNTQLEADYGNCKLLNPARVKYHEISFSKPGLGNGKGIEFMRDVFPVTRKHQCILIGPPGTGKTTAVIAYVVRNCLVYPGPPPAVNARFAKAYEIYNWNQLSAADFTARKMLQDIKVVQYLIIDDLGSEVDGFKGADFVACFEDIWVFRYESQKPTLITSNMTIAQLQERYGDRMFSRFSDDGIIFGIDDSDYRLISSGI
jgi:DNA replication protein DnaC